MTSKNLAPKIALTIAGSDSGGGAGIQADLKTFHQYGVFGTSVIAAVTAQNTVAVTAVHPIPADIVEKQMAAVAEDLRPAATKTGMLATADLVRVVAEGIQRHGFANYVLDPVMVATSGSRLLAIDAEDAMLRRLVPLADLVTPNTEEASILAGRAIRSRADMEDAGKHLIRLGARAVLVKGGHLPGSTVVDVLVTANQTRTFTHARIETTSTHGTGCTLSAAITAGLALGKNLERSVSEAIDFVRRALEAAPGLGTGSGPLSHFVRPTGEPMA
jgi:hydroxymethylpyrimidine/phosphomethylpyrimidine kinase